MAGRFTKPQAGAGSVKDSCTPEPCVGIFWLFDGKLIFDSTPLSKAEPYSTALTHPTGHIDYWTQLQHTGAVPADVEYEEPPRGRIVFYEREQRFHMMADKCILSQRTVADYVREDLKKESWIEVTAAQYLEDELSKQAFFTFTRESPEMKLAFHHGWGQTLSPARPLTRGRLTIIFNNVGIQLANSGDSEGSDRSLACSSLFIKRNPLTWAALAEVALAKEDRMAATWAEKVIKFRLQKSASPELREFLSTDEAKVLLRDARQRMRQIVAECQACTSWHDSTEVFNQMEVSESYFDR